MVITYNDENIIPGNLYGHVLSENRAGPEIKKHLLTDEDICIAHSAILRNAPRPRVILYLVSIRLATNI